MSPQIILILVCWWWMAGCTSSLSWIHETSALHSCHPDRLPEWSDFLPRTPPDVRGAETAIRFFSHPSEQRLSMVFDHAHSWVKPELLTPDDPVLKRISEQLLAHEQGHFLISCLMVRQANLSLTETDDLPHILELTKLTAQDLNLQYDADTDHGLNEHAQQQWEKEIMQQFQQVSIQSEIRAGSASWH